MLELLHNCLRNRNLRVAKPRAFHMWVMDLFFRHVLCRESNRVEKPKKLEIVVDLILRLVLMIIIRTVICCFFSEIKREMQGVCVALIQNYE